MGQTGIQAVALFSNDSKYLIQADRGQVSISDLSGKLLSQVQDQSDDGYGSGEQSQWAYLSSDCEVLIVASRDMDTSGERGVTLWGKGEPAPLSQGDQGPVNPGSGPSSGPSRTTSGDDIFDLAQNEAVDGVGHRYDHLQHEFEYFLIVNGMLTITVHSMVATHTLTNVERVQFSDKALAFDTIMREKQLKLSAHSSVVQHS